MALPLTPATVADLLASRIYLVRQIRMAEATIWNRPDLQFIRDHIESGVRMVELIDERLFGSGLTLKDGAG